MIYDINGVQLSDAYDIDGNDLSTAYDIDGNTVFEKGGRAIVFEDNFNGNSLNETYWDYELGYGRNNELQQYWKRCVTVEDGSLVLTANKLDNTGTAYQSWESGSIFLKDDYCQTYGRFEARIKFPYLVGSFPAFWCLGNSLKTQYAEGERWQKISGGWPSCGEIDIVEMMPGNSDKAKANLWDSSSTSQNPVSLGTGTSSSYDPSQWHIYAMEWTDQYIAMYLDDVEYKRYTWSSITPSKITAYTGDEKMKIILNLAVGASGGTPSSSTSQMKMYVDWVRIYEPLS